jgi:hypothetical protein
MDTEHRAIAELLALKDAPDDVLLDQVEAIGVTTGQQPPVRSFGNEEVAARPFRWRAVPQPAQGLAGKPRPKQNGDRYGHHDSPNPDHDRVFLKRIPHQQEDRTNCYS